MIFCTAAEQGVAPDASIVGLSSNFLASMLGWLSLGAGEQQRWIAIEFFMRVEYFADGSVDCPLLLLYGADPIDAGSLSKALRGLSQSVESRLAIHELPGFSSVAGCRLFASRSGTDIGVKMIQSPNQFECFLRPLSWENIVGLLEPFCHEKGMTVRRFQYLDENGDIRLLISTERAW